MNNMPGDIPFQHLLVTVDGSAQSSRVVATAAALAHKFDSRLTLLSVYRHFSYTNRRYTQVRMGPIDAASPVELSLKSLAEEGIDQARAQLAERGITGADTLIRRGAPATVILRMAEQLAVDTIIMGGRHTGELEGLLLGSVSHKVGSLARCNCIRVC